MYQYFLGEIFQLKKLSLCYEFKSLQSLWFKHLTFKLKYLRSTTYGAKRLENLMFVTKTQFLEKPAHFWFNFFLLFIVYIELLMLKLFAALVWVGLFISREYTYHAPSSPSPSPFQSPLHIPPPSPSPSQHNNNSEFNYNNTVSPYQNFKELQVA